MGSMQERPDLRLLQVRSSSDLPVDQITNVFAVALGAVIGFGCFLLWDACHLNAYKNGARWTQQEEYRRLPLACVGGPLCVTSLFW